MDDLLLLALFGAAFGWLYPLIVGASLGVCVLSGRSFRPSVKQCAALLLPAAGYYFLQYVVGDRQGFNILDSVATLSGAMALVVVAARVAGRPQWIVRGSAGGVALAVVLWLLIPAQGLGRLF